MTDPRPKNSLEDHTPTIENSPFSDYLQKNAKKTQEIEQKLLNIPDKEAHGAFYEALVHASPGTPWLDMVIISDAISDHLDKQQFKNETINRDWINRHRAASHLIVSGDLISKSSDTPENSAFRNAEMKDVLRGSLGYLINTLKTDEETSYEDQINLILAHAHNVFSSLPANNATPENADAIIYVLRRRLDKEADKGGSLINNALLTEESINKHLLQDDLGPAIDNVRRFIDDLDTDKNRAALLYFTTHTLHHIYNYLVAYRDDKDFREQKINSFTDLKRILKQVEALGDKTDLPENEQIDKPDEQIETIDFDELAPQDVAWEVLPAGDLQEAARDIVQNLSQSTPEKRLPKIDLERLNVLEEVRINWGDDKSYYVKGSLGDRGKVKDDSIESPDQYIVLVLQQENQDGQLVDYAAVAESPIVGPHATYVYRQDVNNDELSWDKVMSLNKKEARQKGARPLRHTQGANIADRISILLSAQPDEFKQLEFRGDSFRINKKLAETALKNTPHS